MIHDMHMIYICTCAFLLIYDIIVYILLIWKCILEKKHTSPLFVSYCSVFREHPLLHQYDFDISHVSSRPFCEDYPGYDI